MSNSNPPASPSWKLVAPSALLIGGLIGAAFHNAPGLRSIGSGGACADLSAYVEHVALMQDHRIHATRLGIHRPETISAVNELLDRARCGQHVDEAGRATFQKFQAVVDHDVNDPPPRPAREAAEVETAPGPAVLPSTSIPMRARGTLARRRTVIVSDDQAADASGGFPPCSPPQPGEIDWRSPACRR